MPETPKPYYLTTPIYYVNARPHIGHAYTTIVADVLARRQRLLRPHGAEDVFFLTGTDEHGQKIERSAAAAGIPPQQFADQVSASFAALWKRMGITNNAYIRTTDASHKRGVQKLFSTLYERGFIYLASYTGSYCVSDEAFVDAPIGTPCPDCGRILEEVTEENFFFKLSEFQQPIIDLIESNTLLITPDSRRNEVLSFVKGGLKDLSISRSSFTWGIPVPEPAASTASQKHVIYVWLDALANYMTALGYGSDDETLFQKFWPADLHLVGKEIIRFHCVYWPAFLLALNPEGAKKISDKDGTATNAGAPGLASETWVSREVQGPQLTFEQHKAWAVKWLPKQVTAHGWLLFDNSKMSKSKGNIVRTETILDAFGTLCPPKPAPPSEVVILSGAKDLLSPDTPILHQEATVRVPQGFSLGSHNDEKNEGVLTPEGTPTPADRDLFAADILRYYLLREIPFGQDGSFSFEALITRYNADLANGYGNLVSRTLKMIADNFHETIPVYPTHSQALASNTGDPNFPVRFGTGEIHALISLSCSQSDRWFQASSFEAPTNIAKLIAMTDGYLSTHTPWKLAKLSDEISKAKLAEVLYTAAESIRIITALLYPILPYATARVWAQLGLGDIELAAANGDLTNLTWGGLQPGTRLGPLSPIFPRAPKELAQIMTDLENPTPETPSAPAPTAGAPDLSHLEIGASTALVAPTPAVEQSPTITIDDFAKIDLRVAQITLAERIPKADKLLRLEVDLGPMGTRQILSGIAEFYTPEELTGRRIVVITNLAPRKMRGLESHGMLLAASDTDHGKPALATCGDEIPLGSRLK